MKSASCYKSSVWDLRQQTQDLIYSSETVGKVVCESVLRRTTTQPRLGNWHIMPGATRQGSWVSCKIMLIHNPDLSVLVVTPLQLN